VVLPDNWARVSSIFSKNRNTQQFRDLRSTHSHPIIFCVDYHHPCTPWGWLLNFGDYSLCFCLSFKFSWIGSGIQYVPLMSNVACGPQDSLEHPAQFSLTVYMWLSLWKPVLSSITGSLILSHKHKAWWMYYQISQPRPARVKGSAFSSCFFQALWQAVRAVCGLDRALANQEMAVCGCTALWCWIMTCALKFLSF